MTPGKQVMLTVGIFLVLTALALLLREPKEVRTYRREKERESTTTLEELSAHAESGVVSYGESLIRYGTPPDYDDAVYQSSVHFEDGHSEPITKRESCLISAAYRQGFKHGKEWP